MRKLLIVSALMASTAAMLSWKEVQQGKPGTTLPASISASKLAEAKATLSKQPARNTKNVLATADGGI